MPSANRLILGLLLAFACFGVSTPRYAINCWADNSQATDGGYLETTKPQDPRFVTAISRLTTCMISSETGNYRMGPQYPEESRKRREESDVIMQVFIDSALCVRRATILQSSGYFRLYKASLAFAMNIKFPPSALKNITGVDDGMRTFVFPIKWKLKNPHVPGDRCSGSAICADEKPPTPRSEVAGTPADKADVWMPGHYTHCSTTGYQWNDGQWTSPRPGYHWNAPHRDKFQSKWIFVPGAWEQNK